MLTGRTATAVMLSLARSRYTLGVQFAFLAANAAGVLLGTIYNANTPDLYPNNAHHKLGWIVTWVVSSQVVIGLFASVAGKLRGWGGHGRRKGEQQFFIPVSTEAMAEHQRQNESRFPAAGQRLSNDSGQGTEPNTESLRRSHSMSSSSDNAPIRLKGIQKEYADDDDEDLEADLAAPPSGGRRRSSLTGRIAGLLSSRVWRVLRLIYNVVDRVILILGFLTLCTGIVTYARFFVSSATLEVPSCWTNSFNRRAMAFSPDSLIGSRAAYFFGWVYLPWAGGPEALASSDGLVFFFLALLSFLVMTEVISVAELFADGSILLTCRHGTSGLSNRPRSGGPQPSLLRAP
jgi:hypothetical protein